MMGDANPDARSTRLTRSAPATERPTSTSAGQSVWGLKWSVKGSAPVGKAARSASSRVSSGSINGRKVHKHSVFHKKTSRDLFYLSTFLPEEQGGWLLFLPC